jgi:hypothetical protein
VGDRKGYWAGFLSTFAINGLIWIVILSLDPFGFVADAHQKSQEIVGKFMSAFYGFRSSARGQREIAVVLITDKTLENGETYPLPSVLHRHYLEQIAAQRPAIVFVDLAFFGERLGDHMSDLTEPFEHAGIPVLFAGGRPGGSMPPELEKYRTVTAWQAPDWAYPLWQSDGDNAPKPTAAMAMYQFLRAKDAACRNHGADRDFCNDLVVQWGVKPAPEQSLVSRLPKKCRPITRKVHVDWDWPERLADTARWLGMPDSLSRGLERFAELRIRYVEGWYMSFSSILPGLGENWAFEPRQPCFYPLTIRAETLDDWNDAGVLRKLLKGRAVLYGANVSGVPDFVSSAVHGKVPGVFMHAMALDNLLTYGRSYYHDPGDLSLPLVHRELSLLLVHDMVLSLILILMATASHLPAIAAWKWLHGWYFQALVVIVLLLDFLFTEFVLKWDVRNLLGFFIVIELLHTKLGSFNPLEMIFSREGRTAVSPNQQAKSLTEAKP